MSEVGPTITILISDDIAKVMQNKDKIPYGMQRRIVNGLLKLALPFIEKDAQLFAFALHSGMCSFNVDVSEARIRQAMEVENGDTSQH